MGMKKCEIQIKHTNSSETFSPGDVISGSLYFKVTRSQRLESVNASLRGLSHVSWTRYLPLAPYYKPVNEKRKFLSINLMPTHINDVEDGKHFITFSVKLPPNIPSTFISKIGQIKYEIKVTWRGIFKQNVVKRGLKIIQKQHFQQDLISSNNDLEETIEDNQLLSGKFKAIIKTHKTATIGRVVPVTIYVVNHSRFTNYEIKLSLIQLRTYHTHHEFTKNEKKIVLLRRRNICFTNDMPLLLYYCIPNETLPSTLNNTFAIELQYELCVEIITTWRMNIIKRIPIVLASMPTDA